jgi:penicillin-binding protein 1C
MPHICRKTNRMFFKKIVFKHPKNWSPRAQKWGIFGAAVFIFWLFSLPRPLFKAPFSHVLEDKNGDLLGARIADDGQWRFPEADSLPEKYATCVIEFEDRRFRSHLGVDPIGLARAARQNFSKNRIVSGGSTLTMQVIRLARGNPSRTFWEKIVEIFLATRLELTFSKNKILQLYAAHAPFGGNVVGLEAASWRYFGKKPSLLTWAESATLAVLPNSPALIHPGRNRQKLLDKRNRLLDRLFSEKIISETTCELAKSEPLPDAPIALPDFAPHLLDRVFIEKTTNSTHILSKNQKIRTTIDPNIQQKVVEILARQQAIYRGNDIHNLAAIVLNVRTGDVVAYVGNVVGAGKTHGESVDILRSARSTGSILKPYLYAFALQSGNILPESLLEDVPMQFGNYRPENFAPTFDGLVPARRALVRSLNVPFVSLLQKHGLENFHFSLKKIGLTTLQKPAEHYGLSLILGGAEANLFDITGAYASMSRTLTTFTEQNSRYNLTDFRPPNFLYIDKKKEKTSKNQPKSDAPILSAGAIFNTFLAMQQVERPNALGEWELFAANRRIAWKTGTSIGFRDAWAAGATADFAVGVWVGNADGEGRPGLIGVEKAAPVLFEIFETLPAGGGNWFEPPWDDLVRIPVCRQSGFRATERCSSDSVWVPKTGLNAPLCRFHQILHLESTEKWQVNSACENPSSMIHRPFFVISPLEEYYFKLKNAWYQPPPPFRSDCETGQNDQKNSPMQLIYPKNPTKILVPTELNGQVGRTVFQVAHRAKNIEIFWHLDGQFAGKTSDFHQMSLAPPVGKHVLTLVDISGNRVEMPFEIVGK